MSRRLLAALAAASVLGVIGVYAYWRAAPMSGEGERLEGASAAEVVTFIDAAVSSARGPARMDGMIRVADELERRVEEGTMERPDPIIDKLIQLLEHDLDDVRYWAAICLSRFGPRASRAVPALVQGLNETAGWEVSKSSASGIVVALDDIAPGWCAREDVSATARRLFCPREERRPGDVEPSASSNWPPPR